MAPRTHFTVVLAAVVMVAWCRADVVVVSEESNKTVTAVADLPALFGPSLDTPLKGMLVKASPSDGCSKMAPPPTTNDTWVVLVRRYNCTFVDKVLNAQHAGYSAVIVHNVGSNALQPMSADHKTEEVVIPSVFIGQDDAIMLFENFLYDKGYVVELTDELPFNLQNYLVPFAITIGICFVVMLTFMVVKCVRDYRRSRRHRLSSRALKKLPTHRFKKGDPYECCAVCLEDYQDNDKLRILPCSHAYHCKCIDPWLTKNRRVCPMCKRKVFTGDERPSDLETDSEDENSPLINSEGGTQGGTFSQQRENPFQEAQRAAEERRRRRRRRTVSRNIECGPEGYQRLADSTEDEDDDEDDQDTAEGESRVAVEEEEESTDALVHTHRDSEEASNESGAASNESAAASNESASASNESGVASSDPGPVQIAVDIVNSKPQPPRDHDSSPPHDSAFMV